MSKQEPVAVIGFSGLIDVKGNPVNFPIGTIFYTHPTPEAVQGVVEALESIWAYYPNSWAADTAQAALQAYKEAQK